MRGLLAGVIALAVGGSALSAQERSCLLVLENVDRQGNQVVVGADTNYFAGGNVRLSCRGMPIRMASDSVAAYGGRIIEVIGHMKYRDSTITMDADRGTYFKDGERWESRGNVVASNTGNGSTLTGPSLDYYRVVPGVRDTLEMYAVGRPLIDYVTLDSAGRRQEPYHIVADRVRFKGDDRVWAGGKVTIDRSDFAGRGDSLRLDTGAGNDGSLLGIAPELHGLGKDSFQLTGRRIDFRLEQKELTYLIAKGEGHAVNHDWDLTADTIGLDLHQRKLVQTVAWGRERRPHAISPQREILADSLVLETPDQKMREARAFGSAWVGGPPDSLTHERDWLLGDSVTARFAEHDSAGVARSTLRQVEARGHARSLYRVANKDPAGLPSINYSRADTILVTLKLTGDNGVERVDLSGDVDGVQLTPKAAGADSTAADSSAAPRGATAGPGPGARR